MDKKATKSRNAEHNQMPSDEVTRNKINKHLSDIDDTISEEDLKNINTVTGSENVASATEENTDKKKIEKDRTDDDITPEKEAPTPWEMIGE